MRPGKCRRPQIIDLMILVCAVAIGMYVSRQAESRIKWGTGLSQAAPPWSMRTIDWIETSVLPWVVLMALATLIIRLRHPRPTLRRILRQPGAVACTLGMMTIGFGFLRLVISEIINSLNHVTTASNLYQLDSLLTNGKGLSGSFIIGGWVALAFSGSLHRERGWIDGFGTLVGAIWVFVDLSPWFLFSIILV
jgi:hypothetical protein